MSSDTPDHKFFYSREEMLLKRYMKELGVSGMPATLDQYMSQVVTPALEAQKRQAEGTEILGKAQGAAEQARLMAPVNAQITLAKEIGANAGYQNYLAIIEAIKAYLAVGSKQAEALTAADVKIIANTGRSTEGMRNVMDVFSTKGGTDLGGMLEAYQEVARRLGILMEQERQLVERHAIAAVEYAMQVAGGAGFYRSAGLERRFRDIQAARYHPLQAGPQAEYAGSMALGLPIDRVF